ncbi:flagellar biosynthesis anti-sigma factor FlgM [Anoxynatronum buryatiense]|uniref:Anti-sigma-28 factor, FlgM family n=1 Tax=Anoxynatronum buryatiense TaxID=489973 RepID=A0AA45WW94_9CLOT|nr:flagellar biosynthesis anti-sigma factor FlgM [Anoxynatronum buryatiense]SMP52465.1 anti-sigma-28 factor, FlgM family [Anoxynatronum buryatiense]
MKIQHHPQIIQALQVYQKNRPGAVRQTGEASSVQDKIELSEKAKEFQTAMKAYQKLPEVREDRIAEVKTKMAQGQMATPEEVAAKMIQDSNRSSLF